MLPDMKVSPCSCSPQYHQLPLQTGQDQRPSLPAVDKISKVCITAPVCKLIKSGRRTLRAPAGAAQCSSTSSKCGKLPFLLGISEHRERLRLPTEIDFASLGAVFCASPRPWIQSELSACGLCRLSGSFKPFHGCDSGKIALVAREFHAISAKKRRQVSSRATALSRHWLPQHRQKPKQKTSRAQIQLQPTATMCATCCQRALYQGQSCSTFKVRQSLRSAAWLTVTGLTHTQQLESAPCSRTVVYSAHLEAHIRRRQLCGKLRTLGKKRWKGCQPSSTKKLPPWS